MNELRFFIFGMITGTWVTLVVAYVIMEIMRRKTKKQNKIELLELFLEEATQGLEEILEKLKREEELLLILEKNIAESRKIKNDDA